MHVATRHTRLATRLVIAAALAASAAHAQSSASAAFPVTVQVVAPLTLTVTHALDFGRILTSSTKTLAPGDASAGRFDLQGQGGSNITIGLMMPTELAPTAGSNLPITGWTYVVSDSPALTGTAVSFTGGTAATFLATFQSGAGSTKKYVGIGATVTASASQTTSTYSGTGQVSASYADL